MGKTKDAHGGKSGGAGNWAHSTSKGHAAKANGAKKNGGSQAEPVDGAEHLTRDLARVRAKFAMDPVLAPRNLAAAWTSDTAMEGDESEFVDTVADCIGVGLSLDDALTCWDNGDLACEDSEQADPGALDDEPIIVSVPPVAVRHVTSGHRVVVR